MSANVLFTSSVTLPLLPLRDVVVFPHMVIPLFVGRPKSIKALEAAMQDNKQILLVAQKSADVDDPAAKDLRIAPAGGAVSLTDRSHLVFRNLLIRGGQHCALLRGTGIVCVDGNYDLPGDI